MKKETFGIIAISALLTTGGAALAATNNNLQNTVRHTINSGQKQGLKKQGLVVKRGFENMMWQNADIKSALEAGDYNAWKTAVTKFSSNNPILSKITADNFSQYVNYYQLIKAGKTDEAKTIADSLGLTLGHQFNKTPLTDAQKQAIADKQAAMKAHQQAVDDAITAGDYTAWKTAISGFNPNNPILSKITADNFSQYVQMRQLMKDGKYTEAQAIAKTLGIAEHQG